MWVDCMQILRQGRVDCMQILREGLEHHPQILAAIGVLGPMLFEHQRTTTIKSKIQRSSNTNIQF